MWDYANQFRPAQNILLINGVQLNQFKHYFSSRTKKKVIYVGTFSSWIDSALIIASARLLPSWHFDLFGSNFNPGQDLPTNVSYQGRVESSALPELLSHYAVGLIPAVNCPHILAVERPLKFLQYLAVGLGVASTDWGALRHGMGDFACYGNTPQEFASAIVSAAQQSQRRSKEEIQQYLASFDWDIILAKMLYHLECGFAQQKIVSKH